MSCKKLFIVLIVLAVGLYPKHSLAQNLAVSPTRIVFENGQKMMDVDLLNSGKTRKNFEIFTVNKAMDSQGRLVATKAPAENEAFADKVIRFSPKRVTLGPSASQTIRILSGLKADSPPGEYRSHLVFREVSESRTRTPLFAMSIPVILRHGTLKASFSISDPAWIEDEQTIQFQLNRTGNQSIFGNVSVYWQDEKIGTLNGVGVYLSTPSRNVRVPIKPGYAGKRVRLIFETQDRKVEEIWTIP